MPDETVQQEVHCPSCRRLIPAELFNTDREGFCNHCGARVSAWPTPAPAVPNPVQPVPASVVIRGVDIPFVDLVALFVKTSLAAVPAAIILAAIWFIIGTVFMAAVTGGVAGFR